ncbi:hypothetical protein ACFODZ_07730 [Marinicella sediminis]|uniref:YcxB family protein n=1 Tax=Marinicella sediminis TaxID=1792834 RepID=A0ABV7JFE7_9GAMM|nr:hypothetical protein [Marinicella sediminis]
MNVIEFKVKYSISDYLRAVLFSMAELRSAYQKEGRTTAVWVVRLLSVIIVPVMLIKAVLTKLRHVYLFSVTSQGIKRSHVGQSVLIAWSQLTTVHETGQFLLLDFRYGEHQTGSLLIPLRALSQRQQSVLRGELSHHIHAV